MRGIRLKRGQRTKRGLESDFDPLLTSQIYDKASYRKPSSGEERMAWRFLERNVLDACQGTKASRLREIDSMEAWMDAGDTAPYSFDYWCGLLGVDEGFMKDQFGGFLCQQRHNAMRGIRGNFKILRQIEAVRIEQPHLLSRMDEDCQPAGWGEVLYKCLQCSHTGDWEHFLGYTCVRGQEQPTEGLELLADRAMRVYEEGHSEPLHVGDEYLVRDQGSLPDHELDNGDSSGGRTDDGGSVRASGVGAVAIGPATGSGDTDV